MQRLMQYYRNMSTNTNNRAYSEIKTFVFLDTETTGLPSYEHNMTKITEICLVAVHASHIRLGVFPRVQNKLTVCFNPSKLISDVSEKITGLSNDLLEESFSFSDQTVSSINNFLSHNPQPSCFVAHNGFKFDYPILRREIDKANSSLNKGILCVDTLICFKELLTESTNTELKTVDTVDNVQMNELPQISDLKTDAQGRNENMSLDQSISEIQRRNETTPMKQIIRNEHNYPLPKKIKLTEVKKSLNFGISYKLGDIFSRLLKKDPINSHQADGDVQMLIMCAAHLGDEFVDWCQKNAREFDDIPAMVPGKKIGT